MFRFQPSSTIKNIDSLLPLLKNTMNLTHLMYLALFSKVFRLPGIKLQYKLLDNLLRDLTEVNSLYHLDLSNCGIDDTSSEAIADFIANAKCIGIFK